MQRNALQEEMSHCYVFQGGVECSGLWENKRLMIKVIHEKSPSDVTFLKLFSRGFTDSLEEKKYLKFPFHT